ncbi:MAG TPA: ATP-binding protein [Phototrophicaceae bacterium]|nr:ATP-binding protein [Phototrophicaceae bacterium]
MSETRAAILIAQDDGGDDLRLSSILMQEGYRVEALTATRPFLAEFRRLTPTLILLDSGLHGGNVFALCARLREQGDVPILMLVPDDEAMIERAYSVGATDVLLKPARATILRRRVRILIDGQREAMRARAYETRWQQTFERNRSIQLIVNPKGGQIVDANPAACAFYGYARDELRGKLISDLEEPSPPKHETSLFNFRHRAASGQIYDVKIFSSPFESDGQTLVYMIVHDVTKRKLAEAEAPPAGDVLAEALRNTAAALSSTLDQNEVLDRILEQVNLVVPGESANIMLIEAGVARVARSRGYENRLGTLSTADVAMHVRETPTLNWMVENNRALVIPDVDSFPGWVKLGTDTNWFKSYVGAPIRIGNYVIGFLNIDSNVSRSFSEIEADHLQIFADQAAIAIRNSRLFERVRRQAAEMERRVFQRTAELDFERGQLSAIMDAMTEGVAYTEFANGDYRTRYVNQALVHMTGYEVEEWINQSVNLFRNQDMNDEDFAHLLDIVGENLRSRGDWTYEARLTRKDGTEFDAMTITTAIRSSDRKIAGAVTVVRDISREKALQQERERFVAYASHELRTPITNLKTRLYLMRRQPERMDEHMRVLETVTDRMKRLVEDLLDISRFERGVIKLEFKDVILQDLIRNVVQIQQPEAERKRLALTMAIAETPIHVHADAERLAQVVTNLIINAINYTPDGNGQIEVRLSQVCDVTGNLALVEVEDSGIGIAEEHLPHIFQPFYRVVSQVEGAGLGLSITREIVELHGGEVEVTSRLGIGSTFRFWLPVLDKPQEEA